MEDTKQTQAAGPQKGNAAWDKVKAYGRLYFVDAMSAMAQGLFASLLIGTIISTLGSQLGVPLLEEIGNFAKEMAGPAMAVAIGYALKAPPLVLFSLATVVTPLVTILSGSLLAYVLAPPIGTAAAAVGQLIMWATDLQPFLMGMFVSVLVGVALTLPISSAAICAALGLTGLAGGAAVAGCCAQMVGFAVISFRENRWGGLVAQGLGTSMLQVPNIIKNPRIWIAPTLASAITGPLATCVFRLEMNGAPVSSGMGTCGLVGQIGVIDGWVNDVANGLKAAITPMDWVGLVLLCFVLPAVLSWVLNLGLRKLGWVKDGDMKLDV